MTTMTAVPRTPSTTPHSAHAIHHSRPESANSSRNNWATIQAIVHNSVPPTAIGVMRNCTASGAGSSGERLTRLNASRGVDEGAGEGWEVPSDDTSPMYSATVAATICDVDSKVSRLRISSPGGCGPPVGLGVRSDELAMRR